jgi:hypothetical protein
MHHDAFTAVRWRNNPIGMGAERLQRQAGSGSACAKAFPILTSSIPETQPSPAKVNNLELTVATKLSPPRKTSKTRAQASAPILF